jgi:hypothetical protein
LHDQLDPADVDDPRPVDVRFSVRIPVVSVADSLRERDPDLDWRGVRQRSGANVVVEVGS